MKVKAAPEQPTNYFIYILECSNGSYYTGYTTNIMRRFAEHCRGTAKCKYTRSFPPVRIAVCWQVQSYLSIVLGIEASIKKLSRSAKLELVTNPDHLSSLIVNGNIPSIRELNVTIDEVPLVGWAKQSG
jgi:putative endonuclease